jgi:hypothetical protein
LNQASEEIAYTLVVEGSNVYADLAAAQAAALPSVVRAIAEAIRARAAGGEAQVCREQPAPYEV